MADTIKVGCRIPNGVKLHVYDRVDSPEEPGKKMLHDAGIVELPGPVSSHGDRAGPAPTHTESDVDGRLFGLWMADNRDSDLVTSGSIFEVKAEPAPADGKDAPAADAPKPSPEPVKVDPPSVTKKA